MVICKRNYAESCTCDACRREGERRRRESDGTASVTEHEED
jgi:hypothetical protein